MTPAELLTWSLAELAAGCATGEVSSREATLAVLAGSRGDGRGLDAVARLEPERALQAADAADRLRAGGGELGLLHGVPMAHKDMFYRKGELAECGGPADARPPAGRDRHRPAPAGCGRCHRRRPAEHGRVRARDHRPQRPYRPPAQPVGHQPDHRRLDQRRCRRRGGAADPATLGSDTGGSIRYPGRGLRHPRPEADLRPGQPLRLHAALLLPRSCRPAGAHGRGPGADAAGDRRAGSRRSDHERAAGDRLPGWTRRGAAGLRLAVALGAPDAPVEAEVAALGRGCGRRAGRGGHARAARRPASRSGGSTRCAAS